MKSHSSSEKQTPRGGGRIPLARLTMLALLTAVALMIYALEALLPAPVPIPGIKLGLANVVTLVTLRRFGPKDAFWVLLSRILLSCFFFGNLLSLLYSFCGGLLCMLVIWLVNALLEGNWLYLTGIIGAISHNLAQLCVAYLVTKVPGVFGYLPFLMISAILTGLFTGLCAHFTLKLLPEKFRFEA